MQVCFSCFSEPLSSCRMPPKSRKQRLREEKARVAREAKKAKLDESASEAISTSEETIPTTSCASHAECSEESDRSDATFDPEQETVKSPHALLERFVEDWVLTLDRENVVSLALFLTYHLVHLLNFTTTKAAEYAGIMVGKSDRTVRQWQADFRENGCIPDSKQGHYQRTGVLWSCEDLNKKATKYVRENSNVKGRPNLTKLSFCRWVNEELLPNENLEPGFPRHISTETGRKWLHMLGFEVLSSAKGMFFDGHERKDVVQERKMFLERMVEVGFLHPSEAPTPEAAAAFPSSVPLALSEVREKTAVIFHDESTFQANDDQSIMWGKKGEHMLRPKSKGAGIMVSDFIDNKNGYLALTDEEFRVASLTNPNLPQQARQYLEYGESREGYWTGEKFMKQVEQAVTIADIKYPKERGWRVVWIFDQSSCHKAMAADALDVSKMNIKPGGKQAKLRDTVWAGKPQKMSFNLGVPKGIKQVLKERGINVDGLNGDQMREILKNHDDFKNEKPQVIKFLESKGHTALFLPKFHPEINPIERVWAQSKRYTKAYCKYTLLSLRKNIPLALESVTLDNIQNFHRKCRHYMYAYLEGHVAGGKLEDQVKKYKKAVKSHRRIGVGE